jgi:hypothetical protein
LGASPLRLCCRLSSNFHGEGLSGPDLGPASPGQVAESSGIE